MSNIFSKNRDEDNAELYSPTDVRKDVYRNLMKRSEIKGNILEIGCGTGFMSTLTQNYTGMTKRKSEVIYGKEHNLPIVYGDMLNIPFPDEYFDCVVCVHTLEYTLKQAEAIHEFVRVVKKGGYILILYDCDYIIKDFFCFLSQRDLWVIMRKFGCEVMEQNQIPPSDTSHYLTVARRRDVSEL